MCVRPENNNLTLFNHLIKEKEPLKYFFNNDHELILNMPKFQFLCLVLKLFKISRITFLISVLLHLFIYFYKCILNIEIFKSLGDLNLGIFSEFFQASRY
jgi:hypothetical protein